MGNYKSSIEKKLAQRSEKGTLRSLGILDPEFSDFISNDYLGLAKQKTPIQGDLGSTGSRLISGNSALHLKLEEFLANHHDVESAVLFNSAYLANLGVIQAITEKGDLIFYDQDCHASIKDAVRLSHAQSFKFKHNDLDDLQRQLKKDGNTKIVIVESLYSMGGDRANLLEIKKIVDEFNALLIVDEAHSAGLFSQGTGLVNELRISGENVIQVLGFGKALGCFGGAILSSQLIKDCIINFGRTFIYTTALPEYAIHRILKNYELIKEGDQIVRLREIIDYFIQENTRSTASAMDQIQCVRGDVGWLEKINKACELKKINVKVIKSPTVRAGEEMLRLTLHSYNSKEEIDQLLNIFRRHE
ncbi:MAG: pyridoxal phosphate-dependent aminotransferase family protein [Flavobacteriales bacterium]|nr:pyridoxal phosphate-dependent aminotransferase family protein [Flavobacteriales bacterium]